MQLRWRYSFVGLLCLGCATSGAVDAALHHDLATLQQQIQAEHAQGKLDRARVVELAEAVAEREVMSGSGRSGVHRIRVMRGCAEPLTRVLKARAERDDDGGAEAAQVLLSAHALDATAAFEAHAEAASGAWRAVAARASTRPEFFAQRRKYFVDVDERVRRAALEAALEAPSSADQDTLLEAARLDPDAQSRSLAARAAGASGGERVVLALLDRWDRADEETRIAIVDAWSMPRALGSGGERELAKAAEAGAGMPALAAAQALLRGSGEHAAAAVTLLTRAIQSGDSDERRLAMRMAPLSNAEVLRVVKEAAKDADREVSVMAWARLLELAPQRSAAQAELKKLAKGTDNIAEQARAALAALGDESVKPTLLAALAAKLPGDRQTAALGLVRLGDYGSAARVLADEDATTRATLACTILARDERTR